MKKQFLRFFMGMAVVAVTLSSCSKTDDKKEDDKPAAEVWPTTKTALFLYYTGSECNPCGSTGIPRYENVLADASVAGKFIPISVHCNAPAPDNLYDSKAGAELLGLIVANNSYSAPTYLIPPNAKFSGTATASDATAKSQISTFAAAAPDAVVKAEASVSGSTISVKTRSKFLKLVNGTYKVSVLILEDGVVFHQIVNGVKVDPYTHDQVLRGKFSTSAFGDLLNANGNLGFAADEIAEKTFTGTIPAAVSQPEKNWNKNNLSAVVVLWKHTTVGTSTTVEIVNATKVKLPAVQ